MWCDSGNMSKVTGVVYGSARYPFPLDRILNYYESQRIRQAADASCQSWASVWCIEQRRVHNTRFTAARQLLEHFNSALIALSDRLGDHPFFFGET